VQLIEQEPAIYDKRHADYARRDKIDLALEGIFHRMEESGMCVYVYIYICICVITKTYNRLQIQNMSFVHNINATGCSNTILHNISAKTVQTTTTIWPVLCDISQQLGYSSYSTIISFIQLV
jgi:hypothetical protein